MKCLLTTTLHLHLAHVENDHATILTKFFNTLTNLTRNLPRVDPDTTPLPYRLIQETTPAIKGALSHEKCHLATARTSAPTRAHPEDGEASMTTKNPYRATPATTTPAPKLTVAQGDIMEMI